MVYFTYIGSYMEAVHGSYNDAPKNIGSSTMRFQNEKKLLNVKGSPQFSTILDTITCLTTIVETSSDGDILQLIDMANEVKVEKQYLLLIVPELNRTIFQNKTINFIIMVDHKDKGILYLSVENVIVERQ